MILHTGLPGVLWLTVRVVGGVLWLTVRVVGGVLWRGVTGVAGGYAVVHVAAKFHSGGCPYVFVKR